MKPQTTSAVVRLFRRYHLTWPTIGFLGLVWAFFAVFLFYPVFHMVKGAFITEEGLTLRLLGLFFLNSALKTAVLNSIKLALTTTALTALLALPLAYFSARLRFAGQNLLSSLMLVPLIMPPFVGALGIQQILSRHGGVNVVLMKLGWIHQPINWLLGGFWCVVVLEALHLYPIMYLNLTAAWANVDPSLEEAAESLGASGLRLFRTVTLPLLVPGLLAGAIIVFIWALTDLGTPLMFDYSQVIPVKIFDMVKDINENPMGYVLVVLVLAVTILFFFLSRTFLRTGSFEMLGRGHVAARQKDVSGLRALAVYLLIALVIGLAVLPHLTVVLTSLARTWSLSAVPTAYTTQHYRAVFAYETTTTAVRNSLLYSVLSTVCDVLLGFGLAYLLVRKDFPGKGALDVVAMLPLALPGVVLAFGYVGCFSGTFLDPRKNPIPLLVISYAVRRLPYSLRAAHAGLQQMHVSLEEASASLGASPFTTLRRIAVPLVAANLVAGAILSFSFAMLEVSDSLVLAMTKQYYPITKAIYTLAMRLGDGPYVASALGVLGMALLTASLIVAGRVLGKRMGELFRA